MRKSRVRQFSYNYVVLLPLTGRVWVCCATLLSNGLVGSACGQDRSSDPRGRACRPNEKGTGEDGVFSDFVPALFILPGLKFMFF